MIRRIVGSSHVEVGVYSDRYRNRFYDALCILSTSSWLLIFRGNLVSTVYRTLFTKIFENSSCIVSNYLINLSTV